jgi:hypothetical protein
VVTATDRACRSILTLGNERRTSYGAVKYPMFSATNAESSPLTNMPEHMIVA